MTILTWVLQAVLGIMFIIAGYGKVTGSNMCIENFNKWGYPQWFRTVTGVIELAAVVLLVIGFWKTSAAVIGAAILVAVAIGGVFTHIRVKDTLKNTAMIAVLGVLALILFVILI